MKIQSAGIIAAGEGSRFKQAGILTNKPLIGHTLNYLESAGIARVVIIFNEQEAECVDWVQQNFPSMNCEFIVKSTASSFESFWLVGQKLGEGKHLLCTVDSFCSLPEFKKMVGGPEPDAIYLGVTDFVDDEKPLWVTLDPQTRRIANLGASYGTHATAGFYQVPGHLFKTRPSENLASLRYYLKWLQDQNHPIYGVPLENVIDIDSPKDIAVAEQKLKNL